MKLPDQFVRASRVYNLAAAGASHARVAANALERIAEDALALYHDARQQMTEDRMQETIDRITAHLEALRAAIAARDVALCAERAAAITALDPGAPLGRRLAIESGDQAALLAQFKSRARWYEDYRVPKLEAQAEGRAFRPQYTDSRVLV